MKQIIKFQVTIERSLKQWVVSPEFDKYEDAQAWRHAQEAQLLKENPMRRNVHSNLLFNRYTVEAQ